MNPTALTKLLEALGGVVLALGQWKTFALLLFFTGIAVWYKHYADRRKDRKENALIEEKDRAIARLAGEVREYRSIIIERQYGISAAEARDLIVDVMLERGLVSAPAQGDGSRPTVEGGAQRPAFPAPTAPATNRDGRPKRRRRRRK